MVFVRSGKRLVRVRRDAARLTGSVDFVTPRSGKLFVAVCLDDFELLEPGLSVPGKRLSGI